MFQNTDEFEQYVLDNYPEVTDNRIDLDHWDLRCTHCKITRGFQVIKRQVSGNMVRTYAPPEFRQDYHAPVTYLFRCPVCKAFKQWIIYEIAIVDDQEKPVNHYLG